MVVAVAVGRTGIDTLLVASQVVLSIVLPFVTVPLVYLTSCKSVMTVRKAREPLVMSSPSDTDLRIATPQQVESAEADEMNWLEAFFDNRDGFAYDPSMPAWDEFNRLGRYLSWSRQQSFEERSAFKDALVRSFNDIYGTDENDLANWATLCHILDITPIPENLDGCRDAVKATFVNLVDLVDLPNSEKPLHLFTSEAALSEYTLREHKVFPKGSAYAGGLLRHLLRQIMNPGTRVASRTLLPNGDGSDVVVADRGSKLNANATQLYKLALNFQSSLTMSVTLTVPEGFQYVGASLLSTVFVLIGQSVVVGKWRKRSGIQYPQLYAEKAEVEASKDSYIFNCAQRAHQNTLENLPVIYATTLLTAVKYPIIAASACATWSVARVFYTRGYLTGEPKKVSIALLFKGQVLMEPCEAHQPSQHLRKH
ncbi:hypothetical protein C0991_007747 [Blastosporella zonata]|nr:hypothetical protein C0991_007747 [Blastosporella zonata]